ncbi:hypothetical protein QJ043_09155 [Olsenella sp. YH-ols2217]|uniref:Lipoprotein LpqN n=1 Tax=Kribbibacterium absianum TaxID=3044210 RepID=A0ABT6ZMZ3_9ACTN|nr:MULTISPECIES: hypothetical protein [unclassified Olsenella]MDJ1122344.1 hypothetical protein [Olsenella sp. YH-ols2216]MDJ1130242.1 hypothetical protein [Olsenella sp. YH-ols2217]
MGEKKWTCAPLTAVLAVALVATLGLVGCSAPSGADGSAPSGATAGQPTTTAVADGTFTAQGVTLRVPDGWQAVSTGGVAGIEPPSGAGYIEVSEQSSDLMSMGEGVDSSEAMTGFVATMVASEGLSIDPSSVAVTEKDGRYLAELPLERSVGDVACRGVQLLVGSGETVVAITALCPEDSYDADWSTYQSVLDTATFDVGTAE